jgi:hypothetical protein
MSGMNGKEIVWGCGYSLSTSAMHKQGHFHSDSGRPIKVQPQQMVIGYASAAKAIDDLVEHRLKDALIMIDGARDLDHARERLRDYIKAVRASAEACTTKPGGLPNESDAASQLKMTKASDLYPADDDEIRVRID